MHPTDDIPPDEAPAPAPFRPRMGRLTMIFVGVVVIGLGFSSVIGGDAGSEASDDGPTVSTIDPAVVPRGAMAGEPAPDLLFPLFSGTMFSVADHVANDGRPLVLNLWASWCFPCRNEMPGFSELAEENPDIAFVGVAVEDSVDAALAFSEEIGVSYPLGIEADTRVFDVYPYIGLPTTFLIDENGTITRQIQGEVLKDQLAAYLAFDFE